MRVTEEQTVRGAVLVCGPRPSDLPNVPGFSETTVPRRPSKSDVDPLLVGKDRIVVVGTDADLAAVIVRLLRADRLDIEVGFVPIESGAVANSVAARRWGLPSEKARAVELATESSAREVPLIRDDSGGVLVGRGVFTRVRGEAYCDSDLAWSGSARSISVEPDEAGRCVAARIRETIFRPSTLWRGRAFQIGCQPNVPVLNGLPHGRPVQRWTWYLHTEALLLVR